MSDAKHIVIKLMDQETFFDGKPFPHYEIGWKKGEEFYSWQGCQRKKEEIADWFQIIP